MNAPNIRFLRPFVKKYIYEPFFTYLEGNERRNYPTATQASIKSISPTTLGADSSETHLGPAVM